MIDKNILVNSLQDTQQKEVWISDFQLSRNIGRCIINLPPLNAIVKPWAPYGGNYKELKISNIISGKNNFRPELVSYPMFETKEDALNYYNEQIKLEFQRIEKNKINKIRQFDNYLCKLNNYIRE